MQEVYRLMMEEYRVGQLVLLENAGRALVSLTRRQLGGKLQDQSVTVLAGAGGCGAVGLVAARYLANAGAQVSVVLSRSVETLGPFAAHQQRLLDRIGLPTQTQNLLPASKLVAVLRQSQLVLDALIGGGLHGRPGGSEAFLLQILRQVGGPPIIALDLPSGLPPDGEAVPPNNLTVEAQATLALGLPRLAHIQSQAASFIGELYLADIGVPPSLYTRLGLKVGPLFSASDILLLRRPPGAIT